MRILLGLVVGFILGLYVAVSMPRTADALLARVGMHVRNTR
jgi:hypothetical protein